MARLAIISIDGDLIDTILMEKEHELIGVFDQENAKQATVVPRLGCDSEWIEWSKVNPDINVLLAIDNPVLRKKLLVHYGAHRVVGYISKNSYVSVRSFLGKGTIIQRKVDLSSGVSIGNYTKISIDVTVHHDCIVGNFVTLAPGCRLLGNVSIGNGCYIGSGSVVMPWVTIGDDAVIGAGAVVTKAVQQGSTVAGVPAKMILNTKSSND